MAALSLSAGAMLALCTCGRISFSGPPTEIQVGSDKLELAWDPPPTAVRTGADLVTGYKLYSRPYPGYSSWRLLATIDASESPSVVVTGEDLLPGSYAFAVSATYGDGRESGMHASTESSADPPTGWYINWTGSR